jgi:Zn-dependent protease with chaperone function
MNVALWIVLGVVASLAVWIVATYNRLIGLRNQSANAWRQIDGRAEPTTAIKRGSAHLCIADPLGRSVGIREGFWADLLATHPPMKKRIAALRQMAFQH